MEVLTASQMRRVDARAIDELGIPSLDLMEQAGIGVAQALQEEIPSFPGRPVVLLCGKGNNGGDGLVAARHLLRAGAAVRAVVLGAEAELSADASVQLRRAVEAGVPVDLVVSDAAWAGLSLNLDGGTIVVDALLGTGTRGAARGLIATAIDAINSSPATIVAVDVPSGADADTGKLSGATVRAHRTLTLCRPKPCLLLEPAASHSGPWRVLDIGIPDEAVAAEHPALSWLGAAEAAALMPGRPRDAHKGAFGHLIAVAGSRGKSGAAVILARASLRSGVGLVTVALPRSIQPIVAASLAEAMTDALGETKHGTLARLTAAGARGVLGQRDALALGPGLGTESSTRATVAALLSARTVPAVLDADGLNAFDASRRPHARLRAGRHPLVLTPHPGEAARLAATSVAAIEADRLAAALGLASETGAVVVLKGRHTLVAHPDGRASFNSTGNPGMATGGTGDALTGVIGALLARGLDAFDAARLGTYVHGKAGDLAAGRLGEEGMIAGDLVEELPQAWRLTAGRRHGVDRWTHGA